MQDFPSPVGWTIHALLDFFFYFCGVFIFLWRVFYYFLLSYSSSPLHIKTKIKQHREDEKKTRNTTNTTNKPNTTIKKRGDWFLVVWCVFSSSLLHYSSSSQPNTTTKKEEKSKRNKSRQPFKPLSQQSVAYLEQFEQLAR